MLFCISATAGSDPKTSSTRRGMRRLSYKTQSDSKTDPQAKACGSAATRLIGLLAPRQSLLVVRGRATLLPLLHPSVRSARSVGCVKNGRCVKGVKGVTSPGGRARHAGGRSVRADAVRCVQATWRRSRDASETPCPWHPCAPACQDLADYSLLTPLSLFARLQKQRRGRSLVLAYAVRPAVAAQDADRPAGGLFSPERPAAGVTRRTCRELPPSTNPVE
jgi:hypothetical protein